MPRIPSRLRPFAKGASTLATGAAVGLVATALITPMLPGSTLPGNRHEPPETRGWILATLRGDADAINRLELPTNVAGRALKLQGLDAPAFEPHTLTFLGGSRTGQLGQFGYVLTVARSDGSYDSLPLLITTLGDRVWYLRGGTPGRPAPAAAPSSAPSPGSQPSPSGAGVSPGASAS
jgi:hypothetical protein